MEKRAFERVDSNIQADIYCDNRIFEGTVKNLSENGLYIDTDTSPPCESTILVVIVKEDKVFKLRGKVKRTVRENKKYIGMGVELAKPAHNYYELVSSAMNHFSQTPFSESDKTVTKEEIMNNGIKKTYSKSSSLCKVTFKLPKEAAPEARNVTIVGDFNNWNTSKTRMKKLKDGAFTATINLERDQEYQFRYLIDSTRWENDWEADKYVSTPYGDGDNSVVVV